MANQNEWPTFHNGDVLINLSPTVYMKLHSELLRRHSTYFEDHFSEYTGAPLIPALKRAGAARYRFDLVVRDRDAGGQLCPVELGSNGEPMVHAINFMSNAGMPDTLDAVKAFEMVIGAMHAKPLEIRGGGVKDIMDEIYSILATAEYLGCVSIVTQSIESKLVETGQELWKEVANNPIAWSTFGFRLRSHAITKEAVIHLVGLWKDMTEKVRYSMPMRLRELCEKKSCELEAAIERLNQDLLAFYDPVLTKNDQEYNGNKFSVNIIGWMAMSAMKGHLGKALYEVKGQMANSYGWEFYSRLSQGGTSYFPGSDLEPFWTLFRMKTRGRNHVKDKIDAMKVVIAQMTTEVMLNNTNLKGAQPTSYFICTEVSRADTDALWDDAAHIADSSANCSSASSPLMMPLD